MSTPPFFARSLDAPSAPLKVKIRLRPQEEEVSPKKPFVEKINRPVHISKFAGRMSHTQYGRFLSRKAMKLFADVGIKVIDNFYKPFSLIDHPSTLKTTLVRLSADEYNVSYNTRKSSTMTSSSLIDRYHGKNAVDCELLFYFSGYESEGFVTYFKNTLYGNLLVAESKYDGPFNIMNCFSTVILEHVKDEYFDGHSITIIDGSQLEDQATRINGFLHSAVYYLFDNTIGENMQVVDALGIMFALELTYFSNRIVGEKLLTLLKTEINTRIFNVQKHFVLGVSVLKELYDALHENIRDYLECEEELNKLIDSYSKSFAPPPSFEANYKKLYFIMQQGSDIFEDGIWHRKYTNEEELRHLKNQEMFYNEFFKSDEGESSDEFRRAEQPMDEVEEFTPVVNLPEVGYSFYETTNLKCKRSFKEASMTLDQFDSWCESMIPFEATEKGYESVMKRETIYNKLATDRYHGFGPYASHAVNDSRAAVQDVFTNSKCYESIIAKPDNDSDGIYSSYRALQLVESLKMSSLQKSSRTELLFDFDLHLNVRTICNLAVINGDVQNYNYFSPLITVASGIYYFHVGFKSSNDNYNGGWLHALKIPNHAHMGCQPGYRCSCFKQFPNEKVPVDFDKCFVTFESKIASVLMKMKKIHAKIDGPTGLQYRLSNIQGQLESLQQTIANLEGLKNSISYLITFKYTKSFSDLLIVTQ